jgi:pimeloyl-ACP methyl ester carboxylesterase
MPSKERRFFADVGGVEIHWVEVGRGRPLVLLHGLTDSHRTWRRVAPALALGSRVLMPDLPGHGLSGRPDAPYDLAWYAGVMGAWMDALGLDELDLVGHSFGGGVAQYLLLEHRHRVRRLGLVASGGLGAEVGLGLRLLAVPGLLDRFGQPFLGPATRLVMRTLGSFDADDVAWQGWVNSMPGSARALGRTVRDVVSLRGQRRHFLDHAHAIPDLPPVAVYWGERDPIIPVAHAAGFASMVEGASITRFAACGHFPHRDCAVDLARELGGFLAAPGGGPASLRRAVSVPAAITRRGLLARAWSAIARALRIGRPAAALVSG